jgi:hypothetical protein
MTIMTRSVLAVLLTVSLPVAGFANEPEKVAASVPLEVTELVSGGVWNDDGHSGYYRAMVVSPGAAGEVANVVVQMLAMEKTDAAPKLAKSIVLKEIAEQKIANAFLAMDAENENEMTLVVTAYGAGTDQDTAIQFKFDAKGNYKIMPGGPEEAPAERDPATKN